MKGKSRHRLMFFFGYVLAWASWELAPEETFTSTCDGTILGRGKKVSFYFINRTQRWLLRIKAARAVSFGKISARMRIKFSLGVGRPVKLWFFHSAKYPTKANRAIVWVAIEGGTKRNWSRALWLRTSTEGGGGRNHALSLQQGSGWFAVEICKMTHLLWMIKYIFIASRPTFE